MLNVSENVDRLVTLVLMRSDGTVLGALPTFTATTPWWPDVAEVVETCRAIHGIDVTILRLLDVADFDPRGGMGGKVTYVAELHGAAPAATTPWSAALPDDPLRARPAVQMKTWNLSSIWRLPTAHGDVWLKAVPPFFAHEGAVIHALAAPTLPPLIAFDELGRTLLEDVRGVDQYEAPTDRHAAMIDALVALQAGAVGRVDEILAAGAPDWRAAPFGVAAADVVERGGGELGLDERRVLDRLVAGLDDRFRALAECGIPDTFVHGDFHTGNVRWTETGPVIFDWGDCGIGNPLLDLPPFDRNLDAEHRPAARARWIEQWTAHAPGSDAAKAVALIEPIATLRLAIIYQRFLDGIEQTERRYHEADVPQQLRDAARRATEERR